MAKDGFEPMSRRNVLIGAAGGLAAVLAPGARATAAPDASATISGFVFEDRDGSGVRAADSPGIVGALVSNGRDVAVTGADGRYTLPLPDEATIFVVKPAGFTPPVDPLTRSPRFYSPPSAAGLAGLARSDLRGRRADRAAARLARLPAARARTSRRRSRS